MGGVSWSAGLGGSNSDAKRILSGGIVLRPFFATYFDMKLANIAGCGPFLAEDSSDECPLAVGRSVFLHG